MNRKFEPAKMLFGFRQIVSFPELAIEALGEGIDIPSLRILAGLTPVQKDNDEIREFLHKSLHELTVDWPSEGVTKLLLPMNRNRR